MRSPWVFGLGTVTALTALTACGDETTHNTPLLTTSGTQQGGGGSGAAGGEGGAGGNAAGGNMGGGGDAGGGGIPMFPPVLLTSPEFVANAAIPEASECLLAGGNALNLSPSLSWEGGPATVGSWAVVGRDIDADDGGVVQWVMWNIPGATSQLSSGVENVAMPTSVPGAVQALSYDDTTPGYIGPCGMTGDRYRFSVFAMNEATLSGFDETSNRVEVANYLLNFSLAAGNLLGLTP